MIEIMSPLFSELLLRFGPAENRYDTGDVLFRQDDDVRVLHLVAEGEVHLVRHLAHGLSLTLHRSGAGSILAEASLFSDRYHCGAVAARPTRTLSVPMTKIREALSAGGEFAVAWARFLAGEVQSARLRAEILALRTVGERLDAWLAANAGRLPPRGEWKTVAAEIAVSPEALYRELARRRKRR